MPGLVPGIHVLFVWNEAKAWRAGTSPAMTKTNGTRTQIPPHPHHRRRFLRHVHAAPATRARPLGARVRAGRGCRRHLVLEPLSGRALRRRERAVFLLVLR